MDEKDKGEKGPGLKMPSKKARNDEFSPALEGESRDSSSNISEGESEDEDFIHGSDGGEDLGSASEESEPTQEAEAEKGSETEEEKEEKEEKNSESKSSGHDGKYFVIQKGIVQCDQGFTFPKFKVTSHQKHYWNDDDGQADYLAVTEDDLTFDPAAMPFGQCKLQPTSGGYLPCSYAPAGKWQEPYEKVKVLGKSCLTEVSELMCTVGGKITIMKHGQQSEAGKSNVKKADRREQHIYNPIINFEEFGEEINGNDAEAW